MTVFAFAFTTSLLLLLLLLLASSTACNIVLHRPAGTPSLQVKHSLIDSGFA
jgi:hypothetical protein